MEDIIAISRDTSPTTNRPYVPRTVLQAAIWNQSILRHQIVTSPMPNSTKSPLGENGLGVTVTTAEILARLSSLDDQDYEDEAKTPYFLIPADSSSRLGDNDPSSVDQLFEIRAPAKSNVAPLATSEANCFGILSESHSASSCISTDKTGKSHWSPYPPFRFGVEFWDVDSLKEKSRLHSHTVWYAGSLFNVYVQVMRKKGVQLGIYLHRQSSIDPVPPSSAPSSSITPGTRAGERFSHTHSQSHSSIPKSPTSSLVRPPSRSSTPMSPHPGSPLISSGRVLTPTGTPPVAPASALPTHAPRVAPHQPYRDPRGSMSAYFTISCANVTGSSITRFTSAPDVFSVSQSWGWKSSSLRVEEYLKGEGEEVVPDVTVESEVSLRATIVMGIV
jgi:hypothetical protein